MTAGLRQGSLDRICGEGMPHPFLSRLSVFFQRGFDCAGARVLAAGSGRLAVWLDMPKSVAPQDAALSATARLETSWPSSRLLPLQLSLEVICMLEE